MIWPSSSASSDERAPCSTPARPRAERRRARRLDADQAHVVVGDEVVEHADRVRAAADAGDDGVRQPAFGGEICSRASRPITRCSSRTISGIRRRADARADQVVGRLDVRDPVADRLARRLLQRARAELDRAHLGAEQAHPLDVRRLAPHVLAAHVDDALEPEARADGRRRDAVLAGAGLGDDPLLAEPLRDHRLAERVVQLVRAGVQQVLALQVDALVGREALGARERRRAARVVRQQLVQLARGTPSSLAQRRPAARQLVERRDQRLGDVAPAVGAERPCVCSSCAASTQARTRVVVLDARADSVERAESTAHGRTAAIAVARRSRGPRPPASITRPARRAGALEMRRVVLLPRQVDDRADLLAAAQQHCVARAVAVLAAVELHEVGVGLLDARRRRRRRGAPCRARRARASARRGLSAARMKPTRSAPASTAASTSSWRVSPHTLTSGRESSSRSFAPGSGARISVEPTSTAFAPASSAAAACARVCDRRLSAITMRSRGALREQLELARAGRSRTSTGRGR